MPARAPRICACVRLVPYGDRCPCEARRDAARKRRADANRPTARKRGYDAAWEKVRAAFLMDHPKCVRCDGAATVVDHIIPHRGDMKRFWSRSNWQPLCRSCHSRWKQSTEQHTGASYTPARSRATFSLASSSCGSMILPSEGVLGSSTAATATDEDALALASNVPTTVKNPPVRMALMAMYIECKFATCRPLNPASTPDPKSNNSQPMARTIKPKIETGDFTTSPFSRDEPTVGQGGTQYGAPGVSPDFERPHGDRRGVVRVRSSRNRVFGF